MLLSRRACCLLSSNTCSSVLYSDATNSAVDDVQVQLSVFGTALTRIEQHIATNSSANSVTFNSDNSSSVTSAPITTSTTVHTADTDASTAAAATQQEQHLSSDLATTSSSSTQVGGSGTSSSSTTDNNTGNGPILSSEAFKSLESTLSKLQVPPDAVTRLQDTPIGRGGFATVYKVQLKTNSSTDSGTSSTTICAAKVVKLTELTPRQLQKVYMRFAKELYILSQLQHERVVKLHGAVSTVEELTLLMEVSSTT
jgi:Protein tyrosine and serine/threonine kinase